MAQHKKFKLNINIYNNILLVGTVLFATAGAIIFNTDVIYRCATYKNCSLAYMYFGGFVMLCAYIYKFIIWLLNTTKLDEKW